MMFLFKNYFFICRNVKNNKYSHQLKELMYEFPNASSTERVDQIFKELEESNESTIKGI